MRYIENGHELLTDYETRCLSALSHNVHFYSYTRSTLIVISELMSERIIDGKCLVRHKNTIVSWTGAPKR